MLFHPRQNNNLSWKGVADYFFGLYPHPIYSEAESFYKTYTHGKARTRNLEQLKITKGVDTTLKILLDFAYICGTLGYAKGQVDENILQLAILGEACRALVHFRSIFEIKKVLKKENQKLRKSLEHELN